MTKVVRHGLGCAVFFASLLAARAQLGLPVETNIFGDEIVRRMSGRRTHLASGRSYHLLFHPPRVAGLDDETGEPLVQRDDDHEDTVRNRLRVYHEQTEPLVGFYSHRAAEDAQLKFVRVPGVGSVEEIRLLVLDALK